MTSINVNGKEEHVKHVITKSNLNPGEAHNTDKEHFLSVGSAGAGSTIILMTVISAHEPLRP